MRGTAADDGHTKEKAIIDFLTDPNNFYLSGKDRVSMNACPKIEPFDVVLYRVDEISFEDQAPRKEALENVLSAMKMDGINFIYLIMGDGLGVHFYYGVARNYSKNEPELNIADIGKYILEPGIRGNFRGSKITEIRGVKKRDILSEIAGQTYYSMLEGVPGYVKDDEKFQGVDRLVDVMLGDRFGFMIVASPVNYEELREIERNLYDIYAKIVPLSKRSVQEGSSTSSGETESRGGGMSKSQNESVNITDGTSKTTGTNTSKSTSNGTSTSTGDSYKNQGTNKGGSESKGTTESDGITHSESKTTGGSESESTNYSKGTNSGTSSSSAATVEFVDKKAQDWLKYLDDVILPRLDYGNGKGVFITTSFLFSDSRACLKKLENTAISLYSGETGNKIPLRAVTLKGKQDNGALAFLKNLQLPCGTFSRAMTDNERKAHSALSQFISREKYFSVGNWITTNELAMVAGLPKKDVVGLELREEVEFGLNFKEDIPKEDRIELGNLIQSGNIINRSVYLDKANLDKHMFITGVTGSGKTTTCQNILEESGKPFLVIEPAKTEYRILKDRYPDLLVFTLGKDTVAPFRMNPFEFFPHESITSRVDMIQACIEASFDMEAAIPQIIESAIYACYEDYGWNISTNRNRYYGEHAFDDGVYAFPTLEDLIDKVEKVIDRQGFDVRLRNDYLGSIRARLQGLLVGAKGFMLNAKRSVDFKELLHRRVVLELEEVRSGAEKSLIMGFVLINLTEAIKANYIDVHIADGEPGMEAGNDRCRHITLVEEAHRLLSKYMPGDGQNKKHGVETFSDMLAEIRKYGECLMIADQIPNKLTPEVLKNTNTKIVHRLFAEDDKEAIGNTIVLEKEQREFLSKLGTGCAVVFTQGFNKAVQVQMNQSTDTTFGRAIPEPELRDAAYGFYAEQYKKGTIPGTQLLRMEPTLADIRKIFELNRNDDIGKLLTGYRDGKGGGVKAERRQSLAEAVGLFGKEFIVEYLILTHYCGRPGARSAETIIREKREIIAEFVDKYMKNSFLASDYRKFFDVL